MAAPLLMSEKTLLLTVVNSIRRRHFSINLVNYKLNISRRQSRFISTQNQLWVHRLNASSFFGRSRSDHHDQLHYNQHDRHYGHSEKSSKIGIVAVAAATVTCFGLFKLFWDGFKIFAQESEKPYNCKPSRQVVIPTDTSGLKLTLYQYQTCPFCCKVRAALDYFGFSYDVIEVNSVTKKQLKWSDYQKVPVLVVGANAENKQEVQLKDSSVIISVLESYRQDPKASITQLNSYYPCLTEKEGRKIKYNFLNKYFIMFPITQDSKTQEERIEERQWRQWADDHLVHMLSPNAYRTVGEALQAFNYFSEVGEWEQNFTTLERYVVIYVGASVMYVMGKILKQKYKLNDDVRISLYEACNEWVKAVGKSRLFMGGDKPNLADLSVFGVLSSIEGCIAFQDVLQNTKIGPWYRRMKEAIQNHQGAKTLNRLTSN
ncbi:prostaglandin E synthase 2 [Biomphalaria glabrata]|nr:prostaglandin E synthase 2 [Biomphalaria glabrata]